MNYVCKFEFDKSVDNYLIETEILKSILKTVALFGERQVKRNASYLTADHKAVIDVSGEIGEHVCRIFNERMNRKLGRGRYSFRRVPANAGKDGDVAVKEV